MCKQYDGPAGLLKLLYVRLNPLDSVVYCVAPVLSTRVTSLVSAVNFNVRLNSVLPFQLNVMVSKNGPNHIAKRCSGSTLFGSNYMKVPIIKCRL